MQGKGHYKEIYLTVPSCFCEAAPLMAIVLFSVALKLCIKLSIFSNGETVLILYLPVQIPFFSIFILQVSVLGWCCWVTELHRMAEAGRGL